MPYKFFIDQKGMISSFTDNITDSQDNAKVIKFIACGDTSPVRKLEQVVINKRPSHILDEMESILRKSDIVCVNLEAVFSNRGKPLDRIPVFRLNPDTFNLITKANINVVSLANNHMFDYGPDAFLDTVNLLKENNILYFGAGLSFDEAIKPAILEFKGIKLGFLGFRDEESCWSDKNNVITPQMKRHLVTNCIQRLKPKVDIIILSLHFGWEYQFYPSPRDVNLCREFINKGANLILGHHPHYPQGVETYNNGLIIYSLGNFIWDQNFIGHTNSSYILECCINRKGISHARVIPFRMNNNYQLKILHDQDSFDKLNEISSVLNDRSVLNEKWYFICRDKLIENINIFKKITFNKHNKKRNFIRFIRNIIGHPRSRYTWASLLLYIVSFRAIVYEIRNQLKKFKR